MLNKTSLAGGVLIATAAGVVMTSAPSFAQVLSWGGGGGGCCSSSSFGHFTRNRSWNGNENEGFNHIRLRIHNRNNNIAVARNEEEPARQQPVMIERQQQRPE